MEQLLFDSRRSLIDNLKDNLIFDGKVDMQTAEYCKDIIKRNQYLMSRKREKIVDAESDARIEELRVQIEALDVINMVLADYVEDIGC